MKLEEIAEVVKTNGNGTYKVSTDNGTKRIRLFYNSNYGVCKYRRNSKKYGDLLSNSDIAMWNTIEKYHVDDFVKAKNFIKNVIKYLEKSGLWSNVLDEYKALLALGDSFLAKYIESDYNTQNKMLAENSIGSLFIDDLMCSARKGIVSINYDKWNREHIRNTFAEHIKNKEKYSYKWEKGYDNSIACENINGVMCAWYATEYRGCGNGHYYIALDERHAIYGETD